MGDHRFSEQYSDEEFLAALVAADGAASTLDIANAVNCSKNTALNRLHDLEDQGLVRHRSAGGYVWIITDKGRQQLQT